MLLSRVPARCCLSRITGDPIADGTESITELTESEAIQGAYEQTPEQQVVRGPPAILHLELLRANINAIHSYPTWVPSP